MERYELVDAESSKFWEVGVAGADLTVRFGRIGTAGQSKTKALGDASAAQKEYEKLVKEKTGKGYVLVGAAGAQHAAPRPTAPPPPSVPREQAAPVEAPGHGEMRWPSGGFQWRREWQELLPPVRGIHVPPLPSTPELTHEHVELIANGNDPHSAMWLRQRAGIAGRSWELWTGDRAAQNINAAHIGVADLDYWVELLAQFDVLRWRNRPGWVLHLCLAQHGLRFALEVACDYWEACSRSHYGHDFSQMVAPLRHAIALCGEDEHEDLLLQAARLRDATPAKRILCTHLFAHRADWAAECVRAPSYDRPLLWTCALSPEDFRAMLAYSLTRMDESVTPGVLLQLHVHGNHARGILEFLLGEAVNYGNGADTAEVLKLFSRLHERETLPALGAHLGDRNVREAFERLANDYPAATLCTAMAQCARSQDAGLQGWVLRLALQHAEALPLALDHTDATTRTRFEAALAAFRPQEAATSDLPPILREPPWLAPGGRVELPVLVVTTIRTPEVLHLTDAQRDAANGPRLGWWYKYADAHGYPSSLGLTDQGAESIRKGEPLGPGAVREWQGREAEPSMAYALPEQARLAWWNSYPAKCWTKWNDDEGIWRLFLDFGFAAMPGFLNYIRAFSDHGARMSPLFDSPQLVDLHLQWMHKGKHREAAMRWLRAHPRTVLCHVLPQAFQAAATPERDRSRQAIRWLAGHGLSQQVSSVASEYGPQMAAAVASLLAMDPSALLPAQMPKLPKWFQPTALRRPLLASGGALPAAAVEHLATMLALSQVDAPYPGLAAVRQACTRESLAEFAWDLCEAWLTAGASTKEAWAFKAIGLLGDDQTARRLVPRIREWAEKGAPSRAVAALDLLAAIGSDIALMHLNAFARQNKIKPLQKRAGDMIASVAEARGLSEDELADRLVPSLGLDEESALVIDFGPRQFKLRFDEALLPYLQDAEGQRLKAIPRPNKNDDESKAKAAIERYKTVRKEAEAAASLQVARLERAMVQRRRWPVADWRLFFLQHPLMRHLAARLAWGVFEGQQLTAAFRIAEDWTLADAQDALFTLPENASIGLPHVLEMGPALRQAFSQLFGDYEIAQPFRQLSRETFAFKDDERAQHTLKRFDGRSVASASILALNHRGWAKLDIEEYGVKSYGRDLSNGLQVEIRFDPGMTIGDAKAEPVQKLGALRLLRHGDDGKAALAPFSQLDDVFASEVLRDVELLSPARE